MEKILFLLGSQVKGIQYLFEGVQFGLRGLKIYTNDLIWVKLN